MIENLCLDPGSLHRNPTVHAWLADHHQQIADGAVQFSAEQIPFLFWLRFGEDLLRVRRMDAERKPALRDAQRKRLTAKRAAQAANND